MIWPRNIIIIKRGPLRMLLRTLLQTAKMLIWIVKNILQLLTKYFRHLLILSFIVGIVSGVIGLVYAWLYTPIPLYVLDTLNLRPFFLPSILCNNCTHFHWKYVRHNVSACAPDEDVFLLNLILSFHANAKSRTAIRKSWASVKEYHGYRIKTVFVFGTQADKNLNHQLEVEEKLYSDILMGDFTDSYLNLTMKTVMALTWATTHCKQAKYILKTDDDSFNHPYRIVDYLLQVKQAQFIGGYCFTVIPDRRVSSKYYIDPSVYPDVYYPTYCAGPGYILSQQAARTLLSNYHNVKYLAMEDVFLTGMVRVASKLQYTQIPGMVVGGNQVTNCDLATWAKNTHNIWSQQMEKIWQRALVANAKIDCSTANMKTACIIFLGLLLWIRILVYMFSVGRIM